MSTNRLARLKPIFQLRLEHRGACPARERDNLRRPYGHFVIRDVGQPLELAGSKGSYDLAVMTLSL